MCLQIVNKESPTEKMVVYKLCEVIVNEATENLPKSIILLSAFFKKEIKAGWYEAEGTPKIVRDNDFKYIRIIKEGIIHCYTEVPCIAFTNIILLKCYALPEDFIAWGTNNEIGFKRIFVPKEEIERVLNEV